MYCHLLFIAYYVQQRMKGLKIHHCDGSYQSDTSTTKIKGAHEQEQFKSVINNQSRVERFHSNKMTMRQHTVEAKS